MPAMGIDITLTIAAPPGRVFAAFFDAKALQAWWQVDQAIVAPRIFAPFTITWATTPHRDPVLGPLGGIFHGLVVDLQPPVEAFLGECYWLPPEGEAIGPMAFTIRCGVEGQGCRVRVEQSGFEDSPRWRRYYEIAGPGLRSSLNALKDLLEGDREGAGRKP
jgi:uncharacterized protein YndB with AHSA1/START domain